MKISNTSNISFQGIEKVSISKIKESVSPKPKKNFIISFKLNNNGIPDLANFQEIFNQRGKKCLHLACFQYARKCSTEFFVNGKKVTANRENFRKLELLANLLNRASAESLTKLCCLGKTKIEFTPSIKVVFRRTNWASQQIKNTVRDLVRV